MKSIETTGKTVQEAIDMALEQLGVSLDQVDCTIIDEGSKGIFGIGSKPAKVLVTLLNVNPSDVAKEFLTKVFKDMNLKVTFEVGYDELSKVININVQGEDIGVVIGKRGQTLDSLQYLVNLVVNKGEGDYIRVIMDTENYRERRKETLSNLAFNLAKKAKRTRKNVALEPMNPMERRIIHSSLQNDRFVTTFSEGEEPYRHVVISPKKTY